jgi:hypothetical protein
MSDDVFVMELDFPAPFLPISSSFFTPPTLQQGLQTCLFALSLLILRGERRLWPSQKLQAKQREVLPGNYFVLGARRLETW